MTDYTTDIEGLFYYAEFISNSFSGKLVEFLEENEGWSSVSQSANSRMVLQYGFRYNYVSGNTTEEIESFPRIIRKLRRKIRCIGGIDDSYPLNQCIINRYLPGQGISAHIDSLSYDDYICCVTLGSGAELEFTRNGYDTVSLYTEPDSLYIMSGKARYKWKHCMKGRLTDTVDGVRIHRGTRYSITFRSIIEE